MDWSKAKSMLIIIFAGLNIFLFVNMRVTAKKDYVSKETLATTAIILQNNNVELKCDIPSYGKDTGIPEYKMIKLDRNKITAKLLGSNYTSEDNETVVTFENNEATLKVDDSCSFLYINRKIGENINITNIKEAEDYVKALLEDMGLSMKGFILDSSSTGDNDTIELKYYKQYKNYVLYDSYIKFRAADKSIEYLEYKQKEIKSIKQPMKIISAYQILLKNYLMEENTITDIDIGFKLYKPESGSESIDTPVWRIKTIDGDERYYKAYTGEEV